MKRILQLVFASLTLLMALFPWFTPVVDGSELITHDIQSPAIARNTMGISSLRRVLVYLPDGYQQENQRYPVIYWIPGYTDANSLDEYRQPLDDAIKVGKIPPTIAVFIDVREETTVLNSPEFGNWEDFLIQELIPFIDKTYRTIPDWHQRALMGHSMGGYSALMLPFLHPNIWGAVGINDGSFGVGYDKLLGKETDLPEPMRGDVQYFQGVWKNMPANLEGYKTAGLSEQVYIQLGTTISPNPAAPLHFDVPMDKEGKVVPAALEKWRAYAPIDPATITKHRETLRNLSMIALIVPELNGGLTNRYYTIIMMEQMQAAGIDDIIRLDMPGAHIEFKTERFIALAEQVLKAMESITAVSSKGKVATTWGEIKRGR